MEELTVQASHSSKSDDQRASNVQLPNVHTASRDFAGLLACKGAIEICRFQLNRTRH
jgi:hypothetical protein